MKIASAIAAIEFFQLLAIFHIEANGFQVLVKHAGIHGKGEGFIFARKLINQTRKIAIRPAFRADIIEAQFLLLHINGAGRIGTAG